MKSLGHFLLALYFLSLLMPPVIFEDNDGLEVADSCDVSKKCNDKPNSIPDNEESDSNCISCPGQCCSNYDILAFNFHPRDFIKVQQIQLTNDSVQSNSPSEFWRPPEIS